MKMVRTKVYTKEKILNVAEKILVDKGFSNLTARNIADTMGISTQPIYLEFVNMDDLKRTLICLTFRCDDKISKSNQLIIPDRADMT